MRRCLCGPAGFVILIAMLNGGSRSQAGGTSLTSQLITNAVPNPIHVTYAPGDPTRLFIVQRQGVVHVMTDGAPPTHFLDITTLVSTAAERGLLDLAFHPDYEDNGYFYVRYSGLLGQTTIRRFEVSDNPDVADPGSGYLLFENPDGTFVHNGGFANFGPDGYLYFSQGEGGTSSNAQLLTNFLGKILRIDVNRDDFPADPERNYAIPSDNPYVGIAGNDEIWAHGLRNPFRCGFDRLTGELWIGDVGAGGPEEVSIQAPGDAGNNYGWPCMEGDDCAGGGGCTCNSPVLTLPIFDYTHQEYGCVIIGGHVYRGCAIPDLQGTYFCADYCTSKIMSFRFQNGDIAEFQQRQTELDPPGPTAITSIVSFGEDYYGELYICDLNGEIFKIVPVTEPPDNNGNGVPDICDPPPSPADITGDGVVDIDDLLEVINAWGPCSDCPADISPSPDGDGQVDIDDLLDVINEWT